MGRTAAGPGIAHFPVESDHTSNRKIRLLFLDFEESEEKGGHAKWVLDCLWDWIYREKGYYFDTTDRDMFTLFAKEHCKQPIDFVQRVIQACLQRNIFNLDIYRKTQTLTSGRIQLNYVYATFERRRKGGRIVLRRDLFCVEDTELHYFSMEKYSVNVLTDELKPLLPWIKEHFPWKNEINPRKSTHSIVYNTSSNNRIITTAETEVSEGMEKKDISMEKSDNSTEEQKPHTPPPAAKQKRKPAAAPKKNDSAPYWKEMQEVFNNFIRMNFDGKKYSWNASDGSNMSRLLKEIQKRTEEEGKEWTLGLATVRWNEFLSRAVMDRWLKDNFDLNNLYSKRNKIFLTKPQLNGTAHQGRDTRSTDTAKPNRKSAGAAALVDELRSNLDGQFDV